MKPTQFAVLRPATLTEFFHAEPRWLAHVRYRLPGDEPGNPFDEPSMWITTVEAWRALIDFAEARGHLPPARAARLRAWVASVGEEG